MKVLLSVALALFLVGCSAEQPTPADFLGASPAPSVLHDLPPEVRAFIERKEAEARKLAAKLGLKPDSSTLNYFRLARRGEYRAASHIYQDLRERGGKVESPKHDPKLRLPLWDPLLEVQLTLDAYAAGAGRFATEIGRDIVRSIPPGSIYFGGTDTGRGLAAAFLKAPTARGEFFIVTQNQLCDGQHLDYLRAAFEDKIQILSAADTQQAFQAYLDDAAHRARHDKEFPAQPRQLRPGEDVQFVNGKTNVSGQVAVMAINGLLAEALFDKNQDREFYVEESFPLDWMYPHLVPHGLIMKIQRHPLAELSPDVVAGDLDFWRQRQKELIGSWLTSETSIEEVCAFAERIHLRKDLSGFQGDPEFVKNYYATLAYGKFRSSQAGLYAWRVNNAKSPEERKRMTQVADFAFRQSFAFYPASNETVFRYVNLLLTTGRLDDTLQVVHTATHIAPSNKAFDSLLHQLEGLKSSSK